MKDFPITEKEIQSQILDFLTLKGIFHWRQNSGAMVANRPSGKRGFYRFASINGISDILGVLPDGRFFSIEVKKPKGRLSDNQKEFIDSINRNGGLAIVARSLADVEAALKAEEYL